MRWVCKYATGRKECSFRPVMYAGMLREDLCVEPYNDGSGTKIEGQVLRSNITRQRNALALVSQRAASHLLKCHHVSHHSVDTFLVES